jgi:hypothetical protein
VTLRLGSECCSLFLLKNFVICDQDQESLRLIRQKCCFYFRWLKRASDSFSYQSVSPLCSPFFCSYRLKNVQDPFDNFLLSMEDRKSVEAVPRSQVDPILP